MRKIRIWALTSTLVSMLAFGLSLNAQMQDETIDNSSTTITTTTQQTDTTPAAVDNAPMGTAISGSSTVDVSPADPKSLDFPTTDVLQPSNGADNTDYSKNPYWTPRDWDYVDSNDASGG
jgi:hypothetical protein